MKKLLALSERLKKSRYPKFWAYLEEGELIELERKTAEGVEPFQILYKAKLYWENVSGELSYLLAGVWASLRDDPDRDGLEPLTFEGIPNDNKSSDLTVTVPFRETVEFQPSVGVSHSIAWDGVEWVVVESVGNVAETLEDITAEKVS